MVLEAIFNIQSVVKKPYLMMLFAFIVSSISLWISFYAFKGFSDSISLLSLAFLTVAAAPLLHAEYLKQEEIDSKRHGRSFLSRNFWLVKVYSWFFIGLTISSAVWYIALDDTQGSFCIGSKENCFDIPSRENAFGAQLTTLSSISNLKQRLTGNATGAFSACGSNALCWFNVIFSNNLSVMILAIIFSFVYGAGAIFLIGWNASVVGISIGQSILVDNHFKFLGLLPHGIPELLGYFLAAIGGGLIGVLISKRKFYSKKFQYVLNDASILLILSAISLLVGAIIEALLIVGMPDIAITVSGAYIVMIAFILILKKPLLEKKENKN